MTVQPALHCIHSGTAVDQAGTEREIRELAVTNDIIYITARKPELVEVAGREYAMELGRGWLRVPLIDGDCKTITSPLYQELLSHLPAEITRFDTFLNEHNTSGDAFYRSLGYQEAGRSHIYDTRTERAVLCESDCALLDTNQHESLIELHDAVFPDTFETGREFLNQLSTGK